MFEGLLGMNLVFLKGKVVGFFNLVIPLCCFSFNKTVWLQKKGDWCESRLDPFTFSGEEKQLFSPEMEQMHRFPWHQAALAAVPGDGGRAFRVWIPSGASSSPCHVHGQSQRGAEMERGEFQPL